MAELARISFTATSDGLSVECQGKTIEVLQALTMGAADVLGSIAPQLGMSKDDVAASFCAALMFAMDAAGELTRVDLSGLSKVLQKMKEDEGKRGQNQP